MLYILKTKGPQQEQQKNTFTEQRTFAFLKQTLGGFAGIKQHFKYLGGYNKTLKCD